MNTSNKILAGFFLIVFLVPVMMVMAFKGKIRRNEYKIVNRESFENGNWKTGKLQPAKVIKLIGIPGNALKVNVSYADTARYSYVVGEGDSVQISNTGDTVEIRYRFSGLPRDVSDARLYLDLSLPRMERLIAENAEVDFLSLDSTGSQVLTIDVKGTSRVNMGIVDEGQYVQPGTGKPINLASLSVNIDNSDLYIGHDVSVGQMNIEATGKSKLAINRDAAVGSISGRLSDSSRVDAGWNYMKQLQRLPAQ